jgi:hypothetical protein
MGGGGQSRRERPLKVWDGYKLVRSLDFTRRDRTNRLAPNGPFLDKSPSNRQFQFSGQFTIHSYNNRIITFILYCIVLYVCTI